MKNAILLVVVATVAAVTSAEWVAQSGAPEAGQKVSFSLHLASQMPDSALEEAFWRVSTPGSPSFRQFLGNKEVTELVGASGACRRTVVDALDKARVGSVRVSLHNDYIHVDSTVAAAEEFFGTRLTQFRHSQSGRTKCSCERTPALPAALALSGCVRSVLGLSRPVARHVTDRNVGFAGSTNTPLTLRARYNIPATPLTSAVSQGVAEFEQEQFYASNIAHFAQKYNISAPKISVLGPNNGGYFGEGNLDLEYISSLAPGTHTWWLAENEFTLTKWSEMVLNMTQPPQVLSISWGSGESGFGSAQRDSDNNEFKKLGVTGISVMAAAGDVGTGHQGFLSCGKFDPTWPASSPYVTAVGATYTPSPTADEIGWDKSGGGFSQFYAAPSYQSAATASYVASGGMPPQQFWTKGGRGTPDVAALGTNFEVYSSGWGRESGTSAATPTFSAVITRIVHNRKAAGKGSLGFLNPALYKLGKVGYDVVAGNNKNTWCPTGFPAKKGWDAITGLGTPDYTFLNANL